MAPWQHACRSALIYFSPSTIHHLMYTFRGKHGTPLVPPTWPQPYPDWLCGKSHCLLRLLYSRPTGFENGTDCDTHRWSPEFIPAKPQSPPQPIPDLLERRKLPRLTDVHFIPEVSSNPARKKLSKFMEKEKEKRVS